LMEIFEKTHRIIFKIIYSVLIKTNFNEYKFAGLELNF